MRKFRECRAGTARASAACCVCCVACAFTFWVGGGSGGLNRVSYLSAMATVAAETIAVIVAMASFRPHCGIARIVRQVLSQLYGLQSRGGFHGPWSMIHTIDYAKRVISNALLISSQAYRQRWMLLLLAVPQRVQACTWTTTGASRCTVESLDLTTVNANYKGFSGVAASTSHAYYTPFVIGPAPTDFHGNAVRVSLTDWTTSGVQNLNLASINANYKLSLIHI